MPLQDLTPQLRMRLNKMERAVGWFVFLATALLLFGFGYYIYHTAERKGWFLIKAPFHTFVRSSAGLNVGDPVVMMGFPVGQITLIHVTEPGDIGKIPRTDLRKSEAMNAFFFAPALAGGTAANLFSSHPSLEKRLDQLNKLEKELNG